MSRKCSLAEISRGKSYHIAGFQQTTSPYVEKLHKMGFVIGTPIELAPVKQSDPIVVKIRGSRVALRRREASQVHVEETIK